MFPIILTTTLLEKIKNNSTANIINKMIESKHLNKNNLQKFLYEQYKNIDIPNEYIDFLTIVKDGEFYYTNVFPKIYKDITKNIKARFFIYENNSEDNTKEILNKLSRKYSNIIVKSENTIKKDRIDNIINARNALSVFYKEWVLKNGIGGKWLFIFDTDIIFNYKESVFPLLVSKKNIDTLMVLTYSVYGGYNERLNKILSKKKISNEERNFLELMLIYYYDTFALNLGEFYKKNSLRILNSSNKIKTGFGGLGIIRTEYYLISFYDKTNVKRNFANKYLDNNKYCEHWGYGERLNKIGDLYINKKSQSLWYQERDYEQNDFKDYVKFFIKNKKLNNIL
jgi:hypothetical protein